MDDNYILASIFYLLPSTTIILIQQSIVLYLPNPNFCDMDL
jgi:hypothetical protein